MKQHNARRSRRIELLHAVNPLRAFEQLRAYDCTPTMPNGRAATIEDAQRAERVQCWHDGNKLRAIYSKPKRQQNEKI